MSSPWLASPVTQHVLRELSTLVESTDGLYGYEVDEVAGTIIVVHHEDLDHTLSTLETSEILRSAEAAIAEDNLRVAASDLSDLEPAEQRAVIADMLQLNLLSQADIDIAVEFRSICRADAGDLEAVQRGLESFSWIDSSVPDNLEFAVQRNLADGVVEVVLEGQGPGTARIEEKLKREFGTDVKVVVDPDHAMFATGQVTSKTSVAGRTFQAGRYADKSPHLGGVQFGDWRFRSGACTTGFAINLPEGGRAMLTAGHCDTVIPLHSYVYSGVFNRGDSHNYYGQFYRSYWSELDVGLIGSGTQTYRRSIYTDPDPSGVSQRLVTSVWEPWVGASVCMSGSFTGNVCGGKVISQFSGCLRDGPVSRCGYQYSVERSDGRAMSQPGDSGGPVYLPHGRTGARALGIISTGLGSTTTFLGSQAINKATGGWIASSCCDADTW